MAFKSTTDLDQAATALSAWLTERQGGPAVTAADISTPASGGYSNETLLFTSIQGDGHRGMVGRLAPDGPALYPSYDITSQARLMQILAETSDVPVPKIVGVENDPAVLGSPFFVMERIEGRVPGDDPPFTMGGWVPELDPERQAAMYDNALRALTQVHSVDISQLDFLARPELGKTPLDQQIAYYRDYYEWAADGDPIAAIEDGLRWIEEHRPHEPEPTVLSWGDARMGNMIFDDDMNVVAVLDWEMAWLGSPEIDLGWWVFFDRYYTESIGAPLLPGFPDRQTSMARYTELTGHQPRHLDFYEAFAAFRGAVIALRLAKLMIAGAILPPDSDMPTNNPAVNTMSELMGLAASTEKKWGFARSNENE